MNPEDKDLIIRAARGEARAVNDVLRRHAPFVHGVAWRVVRNSADAADITQDVLIKVASSLPQLRGVEGFQSWLYRIAYRLSLNWLRARRRLPYPEELDEDQLPASSEPAGDSAPEERAARLLQAIEGLPASSRLIVRLFYFEERSCQEIATTLGISVSAVKVQLHRARKLIRTRMAEA